MALWTLHVYNHEWLYVIIEAGCQGTVTCEQFLFVTFYGNILQFVQNIEKLVSALVHQAVGGAT